MNAGFPQTPATLAMPNVRFFFAATFICSALVIFQFCFAGSASSKAITNFESLLGLLFICSFVVLKSQPAVHPPDRRHMPRAVLVLAIAPFLLTFTVPFLYDSYSHVVTASAEPLSQVLRTAYVHPTDGDFFFRPLGYLDYWIESKWAGYSPPLWHVSSCLFHLIAIYLLLSLGERIGLSKWASLCAALLFGLHGTGPEVISWLAARFDQLCTCFVLLTLVALCAYVDKKKTFTLMVAGAVCALLSKEAAFCLPALAGCCLWYRGQLDRRGIKAIAALALTCSLVFAYRLWVLGGIGGYKDGSGAPTILHFSLLRTLELLFFRAWGVILFPVNWAWFPSSILTAALLLFIGSAAVAIVLSRPAPRKVIASVGFVMASLLPVSHLALLDNRLTGARVFHLAIIGFALLVGAIYDGFRDRKFAMPVMTAFLAFQCVALIHNLLIWRSTADLAGRTCTAFPAMLNGHTKATVLHLPSTHNGVFFLRNGFSNCVLLNSGTRAEISEVASGESNDPTFAWDERSQTIKPIPE